MTWFGGAHPPLARHTFSVGQSVSEPHGAQPSFTHAGVVPVHALGSVAVHATQARLVGSHTAAEPLQSPSLPQPVAASTAQLPPGQ
jgi:hypothetical protein